MDKRDYADKSWLRSKPDPWEGPATVLANVIWFGIIGVIVWLVFTS